MYEATQKEACKYLETSFTGRSDVILYGQCHAKRIL